MNPFVSVINSLLAEPHAGLLNGILFGTRASMTKDFYSALVATGVLHIIALSGVNITILISLVAKLTLFLGRKISSLLTVLIIFAFVMFVGPSPSVVRAAIMGSLSLLAVILGRKDWGILSLFLSAGIMLLFDFSLLKNISFQLSFLATLGIMLFARSSLQQKRSSIDRVLYGFRENLKMTLSAQAFTLPVILFNFHRISLIAPLTNILIEWAVQPIMVLGFITSILGWVWYPLGIIPAWITWVPLTYVITIVDVLAKVPGASIQF